MKTLPPLPIGSTGKGVGQQTEQHEHEVHDEAQPNDQTGLGVTPHLNQTVVDDV